MHWPIRRKIALDLEEMEKYVCFISAEDYLYLPTGLFVCVCVFLFSVAPTIQEIKSGTVAPGRSGLIRCEGAGVPPPAFEWYKGEKK